MCGFGVLLNTDGRTVRPEIMEGLISTIEHRGPDQGGVMALDNIGMGFRRLSIQDLSESGSQPMATQDGQLVIVFNGEIYNFIELRKELQKLGYVFKSKSDTEVLLYSYREWGFDCVNKFNGMWSFLIHDKKKNILFGSRDRFGVKPLFYSKQKNYVIFGSEIKLIKKHLGHNVSENWTQIASFFLDGDLDCNTETFYNGVTSIPAGNSFTVNAAGDFNQWHYWNITRQCLDLPDEEIIHEYSQLFEDSVKLRLRSDVPVGVFLSGGLDSTSIICSMARYLDFNENDGLFAFSYNDMDYDESRYITETISQTKARLINLSVTPKDLWECLPAVINAHDEPVHSMTALVGYKLMELASEHGIKVVLNGQGADEVAAGYPSYFNNHWHSLITQKKLFSLWNETKSYSSVHGGKAFKLMSASILKYIQSNLHSFDTYTNLVSNYKKKNLIASETWMNKEYAECYVGSSVNIGSDQGLNSVLRNSVTIDPLPIYLRVEDRNSMAHSIEARLPFMDYRLVDYSFKIRNNMKMRGSWNKYVVRKAMQGKIPDMVCDRPDKMGFPTSSDKWFKGVLKDDLLDIVGSQKFRERGIFDTKKIQKDLQLYFNGQLNVGNKIFRAVQLELWFDSLRS